MNIFVRISNAWRSFFRRRRLSLQNPSDNRVVWYTHISPMSMLLAFISFTTLMFIVVLTLVGYSSILEIFPGYRSDISKSREIMVANILRIDSMERVINDMMLYNDNIALIMEGKSPVVRNSQLNDSLLRLDKAMVSPNDIDSALREQMEGEGEYNLARAAIINSSLRLISPMMGEITQRFNLSEGSRSIKIEASGAERVVEAVADGTVILSLWSPEVGYIVEVQHSRGLISIYKNLSQTMVKSGDVVNGGMVVGYNQADTEFEFELWENGAPSNPENYIIF